MAAWMVSALALLRALFLGTPLRALGTGVGAGSLIGPAIPESIGGPAGGGGFFDFGGGGGRPRRRRRRRALTASDRADIAFIAGLLGPKAGRDFATIVATRS